MADGTSLSLPGLRAVAAAHERGEQAKAVQTASTAASSELLDEALIARICANDNEALGLLFRRYARLVWSIARRILRNNEEADDLLQDVFLFVRRKATIFDSAKGTTRSFLVFLTYQRAISRRRYLTCRHFYASSGRETEPALSVSAAGRAGYDESLEAHFGREGLRKAFAELSNEQRETLRLYFFEGYSLEEIAIETGQDYGNVRHHYYRGLEKLRRRLPGCLCRSSAEGRH